MTQIRAVCFVDGLREALQGRQIPKVRYTDGVVIDVDHISSLESVNSWTIISVFIFLHK